MEGANEADGPRSSTDEVTIDISDGLPRLIARGDRPALTDQVVRATLESTR